MNTVVCPFRSGVEMTKEAIRSFFAQDIETNVIIVNNSGRPMSSQDFGIDERMLPRFGLAFTGFVKSVARIWNESIEILFGSSHQRDHILICNNDVILRPDTYRLLLADGGEFVTAVGVAERDRIGGEPNPSSRRPHPDFSCFLIRHSAWEKTGPFDEGFEGAYCEDCDYHLRMHQAGVDAYCIGVPFYHRVSGTMKSDPSLAAEINRKADANRRRFLAKWGCQPGDKRYYEYFSEPAKVEVGA